MNGDVRELGAGRTFDTRWWEDAPRKVRLDAEVPSRACKRAERVSNEMVENGVCPFPSGSIT